MPKEQKIISLDEWVGHILRVHPRPTVLMILVDKDGKFNLLGAASNLEAMNLVLNEKEKNPLAF